MLVDKREKKQEKGLYDKGDTSVCDVYDHYIVSYSL